MLKVHLFPQLIYRIKNINYHILQKSKLIEVGSMKFGKDKQKDNYISLPAKAEKSKKLLSLEKIKAELNDTDDLKTREIQINRQEYIIFYISNIVDQEKLESKVIEPLTKVNSADILQEVYSEEVKQVNAETEIIDGLLDGFCFLVQKEEATEGFLLKVTASLGREISEILTEKTVVGSYEGFVENLDENIGLLRKRIKSPSFKVKDFEIGEKAPTRLSLAYLENNADSKILKEIEEHLESIELDFLDSPGDIQDYIEGSTYSPFPQLLITENPVRATSNMMDGKIALLVDGSATIFILPATFVVFFQSPDDFISRWWLGSFFRIVRLIGYIFALTLPALYVAIISYHYEIIPTDLVYSFQPSLSYVPFSPIIELIAMQFAFEFLREASLRLPPSVAATFGIVGAIVVGTAMVEAGFVSYGGLIVVAMTAVASFVQPNFEMSSTIRILGLPLMILAGIFGVMGIVFGLLLILIHLTRLTSFGVPYFTPFAPLKIHDFKDTIIRTPIWMRKQQSKTSPQHRKKKTKWEWKLHEGEDPY